MYCECGCGQEAPVAKLTDLSRGYVKGKRRRFVHGHNNRGRPRTEQERRAIGAAKTGERHHFWSGDDVSYKAVHKWVLKRKERLGECQHCGAPERKTHFANISGLYLRNVGDYVELCVPCHRIFDGLDE